MALIRIKMKVMTLMLLLSNIVMKNADLKVILLMNVTTLMNYNTTDNATSQFNDHNDDTIITTASVTIADGNDINIYDDTEFNDEIDERKAIIMMMKMLLVQTKT